MTESLDWYEVLVNPSINHSYDGNWVARPPTGPLREFMQLLDLPKLKCFAVAGADIAWFYIHRDLIDGGPWMVNTASHTP